MSGLAGDLAVLAAATAVALVVILAAAAAHVYWSLRTSTNCVRDKVFRRRCAAGYDGGSRL